MTFSMACPKCEGTKVTRIMEATISYLVEIDEDGLFEMIEPSDVVHGQVQYELMGSWGDNLSCANKECNFEGDSDDFITEEDDDEDLDDDEENDDEDEDEED